MDFKTLFHEKKAIIGMVHLLPLPGSPAYGGNLEAIWQRAKEDLSRLTQGGVSAAIVENFSDIPYTTDLCPTAVNAMAILLDRLQQEARIPLGVNVHYNCTDSEWDLAYLTDCAFLRVEAFVENRVGPQGISWASAPTLLRRKATLPCDAMIFADINVKHTFPMVDQPISFSIESAKESGADAIIITGMKTGNIPKLSDVREARKSAGELPILIGSGISESTISDYLTVADGVIVGSSIKEDGNVWNPVDVTRVRSLMAQVGA